MRGCVPALLCCALLGEVLCWSSVPVHEVNALYSLYIATSGDSWTYNSEKHDIHDGGKPWNFSLPVEDTDPCVDEWLGVKCSSSAEACVSQTCSISQLYMSSYNMKGIPIQYIFPLIMCRYSSFSSHQSHEPESHVSLFQSALRITSCVRC